NAVNAESEGPGKTHRARPYQFRVTAREDGLAITAWSSKDKGTGERGGNSKTINYHVVIDFEPSDLQIILEAAIKTHLITIPGSEGVAEAIKVLENALSKMGANR